MNSLQEKIRPYLNSKMILMLLMGFSSGLPLLLTGAVLKIWFRRADMDLTTIGLFSAVSLPYGFKFLWAPFLDRYTLPLGRRRGWIVLSQIAVAIGLFAMSAGDPVAAPLYMAAVAFLISFFSATQDSALDAYRREYLHTLEFGLGNSIFITGYRLGMMMANAGALFLADVVPFPVVYMIMAACMGVGLVTTFIAKEPQVTAPPPTNLGKAFYEPLVEFFSRRGAIAMLLFIILYKLGDNMAAEMTGPFYVDLKYSNSEIAAIAKVFGIWAIIVGGLVGGIILMKLGVLRSLWIFGILQAASTAGFAWLASNPPSPELIAAIEAGNAHADRVGLAIVISFENFTAGMGMAAFATFMATLTNKRFTATQYALLSSLMAVPRIAAGMSTGWIADNFGWINFFVVCTLVAIPGLLMLIYVGKVYREDAQES